MSTKNAAPILLVDDHADSRAVLRELLESDGYLTLEAGNGKEAIDLLMSRANLEPCLIVLDLEMPIMSGWEFLAITRSYHRLAKIPVLVTSGSQRAAETLAHDAVITYLTKPIDLSSLLATVADCARRPAGSPDGT